MFAGGGGGGFGGGGGGGGGVGVPPASSAAMTWNAQVAQWMKQLLSSAPCAPVSELRVAGQLGAGSYGTVFLVHNRYGTPFAYKCWKTVTGLPTEDDVREIAMLRVNKTMGCPHLARFEAIVVDDHSRMVGVLMEYIDGVTLYDFVHNPARPPFTWGVALKLLRDVADGLAYLHAGGVMHRDIKSPNVIVRVAPHAPYGYEAVIVDFGAARLQPPPGIEATANRGTFSYMAPEVINVAEDRIVGQRMYSFSADVYSLGNLLLEMVTRRMPYIDAFGEDTRRMREAVVSGRVQVVPEGVLAPVAQVIYACVNPDPRLRPAARDVVTAMDGVLAQYGHMMNEPIFLQRLMAVELHSVVSARFATRAPANAAAASQIFAATQHQLSSAAMAVQQQLQLQQLQQQQQQQPPRGPPPTPPSTSTL